MNKEKLPSFVVLMILTTITILFWISFSIYQAFVKNSDPVVPEEVSRAIDPKFDQQTFQLMKNKLYP